MTAGVPRYDCEDVNALIGLFALDALTELEAEGVRAHLATCDRDHGDAECMAFSAGALASSVEPVDAPMELRERLLTAVASTAQVPDPLPDPMVVPKATADIPGPISLEAARERRGPSRLAWIGLAAAAAVVILVLGAWNVSLQRSASDAQQQLAVAQQQVQDASGQLTQLQGQIDQTQARLTAALQRVDAADAQVTSLQQQLQDQHVQLASAQDRIAAAEGQVALVSQAVAAATASGSNVATLASTSAAGGPAGMAIFPARGTGYIMVEGLPELGPDQTYQAWYLADGTPTSAGLITAGPKGLAVIGGLEPVAGTDTIALTVEPAGGVAQPTGDVVVAGKLPTVVAVVHVPARG